jgi:hypothetical protein
MIWRLLRVPREIAQALIRVLFAPREDVRVSAHEALPALVAPDAELPRVRLALPDAAPALFLADAAESGVELADLLHVLREGGAYRTAQEMAAALRRGGKSQATTNAVREILKHEGARHVEVRLRDEPGGKVAEFRARPTA